MKIEEHASLTALNTFGLHPNARVLAEFDNKDELRALLHRYSGERFLTVGEGSNLLFLRDFDGVVLHSRMCRARALKETKDEVWIEAESGLRLDDLIQQLADMDLRGLENLSHIPGTVGASAVQNVGAYGVEAKDVIETVRAIAVQTGEEVTFTNADCCFAYRDSRFKNDWKDQYVITAVTFRLKKEGGLRLDYGGLGNAFEGRDLSQLTPLEVREKVIEIRRRKLPEVGEFGSAGSFFKNPVISRTCFEALQTQYPAMPHFDTSDGVKVPAAWLIEQCGLKGCQHGGARVWDKQPLVIVNAGKASAEDIRLLADKVMKDVSGRFGITLSPEVNYIE